MFRPSPLQRLAELAGRAHDEQDPVTHADLRTSVADARAALCIAQGVALDDIHSATGYNVAPDTYRKVRAMWLGMLAERPGDQYRRADWEQIRTRWIERRPDVVVAVEGGA